MRQDIEKALLRLQIETKEIRKGLHEHILIMILVLLSIFVIPYFTELRVLLPLSVIVFLAGSPYFMGVIVSYYRPLERESLAFQKIALAIQTLEKSNEPIAYAEAYRCLKHAHKILKGRQLRHINWYNDTNKALGRFIENLELIVLPAISGSSIKLEHLEEIALAVYTTNPMKLEEINKTLEASYKKTERKPTKKFTEKFREHTVGKFLISLGFGYGLVLALCLIYTIATQQDFLIFARDRPDIVVLGGLIASGITFWRTK